MLSLTFAHITYLTIYDLTDSGLLELKSLLALVKKKDHASL